MKKITMIKIPGCPYCAKAKKAFEELCQKPEYANAEVEVIDEQLQPELVTPYNGKYYYVPSLFIDGEKLFEATASTTMYRASSSTGKSFSKPSPDRITRQSRQL